MNKKFFIPLHVIKAMGLALLVLIGDQVTKQAVLDFFGSHKNFATNFFVTDFFNLVLVYNKGISFGMLQHDATFMPILLTLLALGIVIFLLVWLWRATHTLTILALALLIGGAIGNMVDRIRFGAVVDFLDFHAFGWHWPAFNIADSAVVCGAVLLFVQSLVFDTKKRQ